MTEAKSYEVLLECESVFNEIADIWRRLNV
jgi:hypothetical protein